VGAKGKDLHYGYKKKGHLISSSMSCKGAKDYQVQDLPTRFFGGSRPLGLEIERDCGKESDIGGRARCFGCGP